MKLFRTLALATAVIAFTLALSIPVIPDSDATTRQVKKTGLVEGVKAPLQLAEVATEHQTKLKQIHSSYFVKVGDTLSDIFSSHHIAYRTLQGIIAADVSSLHLDTIKPGDHLEFVLDSQTNELLTLIYHISLVEQAIYAREENGRFTFEFKEQPGEWQERLYSGNISGSFSLAAHQSGLSSEQIVQITRLLNDKIDFSRSVRAGDRFDVLVNEQFVQGHATGNSEITAISLKLARGEVAAFLADDGRFYDREGNSLERAFNRYPVDKKYRRITSAFNPRRKHPVTGRITPHNGTDFATPVGAPVYATGDGKVIGVRNHPYAGKYLVIEHNSVYTTRYLHLDQFLVKKGQYVTRGQKIALAGQTGRLTGPHLHFEVLVRNRAVDPIKADLPIARSIPNENKPIFYARIDEFDYIVGIYSQELQG